MAIVNYGPLFPANRVFSTLGSGGRPVNSTAFTPNATRDTYVSYSVSCSAQITLLGGGTSTATLQTSPTGSVWTDVAQTSSGITGTVLVGITVTNTQVGLLSTIVPAGYQARIVSSGTTAFVNGAEVQL